MNRAGAGVAPAGEVSPVEGGRGEIGRVESRDRLETAELAEPGGVRGESPAVDERAHAAVLRDPLELVNRRSGGERDDDDPALRAAEEDFEELDAVVGEEADPIAFSELEALRHGERRPRRPRIELGVGEPRGAVGEDERLPGGRQPGALAEQVAVQRHEPSASRRIATNSSAHSPCGT